MKKILKIILILIVLSIVTILIINNNKATQETDKIKEIKKKEESSKEVLDNKNLLIATDLKNKIFLIKENGDKVDLFDITNYKKGIAYAIDNNILYLYLNSEIGYINLDDDQHKYVKIKELDNQYAKSIATLDDNIYYITNENKAYKYNKTTENNAEYSVLNKVSNIYKLTNNSIAYFKASTMDSKSEVGIINTDNNSINVISKNANIEYVYNDLLIYKKYNENNTNWTYFKYDIKTNQSEKISDDTYSSENIYASFIIPFNDYFIYVNQSKLYEYKNEKSTEIFDIKNNIDSINLISKDKLNIFSFGDDNAINIDLNINDLKETKINENKRLYSIIYTK